ncbi:hypothetical protein BJY52DRAFT_1183327 [Lactarius psammicola]|nr:hypothetical protein BJY52DRAFT_1183327 [Lactarius psammicola]
MSTHTRTARLENRNSFPRLPSRPGRMLLGGAAIIGGTFAGDMGSTESRRQSTLCAAPALESVADTDAGTVEPRASPPAPPNRDPNRSAQHRTLAFWRRALLGERCENAARATA